MTRDPGPAARPPDEPADEPVEDARGLLCPLPVIRLGERARALAPGACITLLADDPLAEDDVRQWCRGHGHAVVSVAREAEFVRIQVKIRGA